MVIAAPAQIMRILFFVVASWITTGGAAAQKVLTVTPDTLYYPGQQIVTVTNTSAGESTLDSVAVDFGGARAWFIKVETPDTTLGEYYVSASDEMGASIGLGLPIGSGEAIQVHFVGFDPCIICKVGGTNVVADTLVVYAGGTSLPNRVVIDVSTFVSVEPSSDLPRSAIFEVYPNPTDGRMNIEIELDRSANLDLELYDIRGRNVLHRSIIVSGWHEFEVDIGDLPAGLYVVRVSGWRSRSKSRMVILTP